MTNLRSNMASISPILIFSCFSLLVGDMLFGYDTASFGGILANTGFINQFGTYNPKTKAYAISSTHTSLLSSLPFIGKWIGCLVAGPAIERYGHRMVFYILSAISMIGIIIEITAAGTAHGTGRYAQFIVGRIIVYISVGLVEVDVTTYQSEIVPAAFRGFVVVSLQLFLNAGTIVATGINRAFSTDTSSVGWKTVTGIQFAFSVLIVICVYFIPNSPRWLLSKDREEEAVAALRHLRSHGDFESGRCDEEIQAIRLSLQESVHKAPWTDMFRGTNVRPTMLVIFYYFFQQVNYGAEAFTYPVINSCLGFLSVLPGMYFVDKFGRRPSLMTSYFFQAFWMFLLAGLGERTRNTSTTKNMIVASFMLYSFFYNMSGASIPYLLGAEIPNAALREKTQSLGASWNVIWAFVTNFVIPYIISSIHFQIGWVFGSISIVAFIFTFFLLPETKASFLPLFYPYGLVY
ncbi:hypothetical protein ZTR_01918 [Talaromyces verruculosus]|nr:hypothetical protein ZTR_01918 [Talaromyces verruculosus]